MRWKSSVTVSALVAMSVILVLALALSNFVFFMVQNSQWDYEKTRGRWFLEGRVQEYFDAVMSGSEQVKEGRRELQEKIEGKEQYYSFDISKQDKGYAFTARMLWKNRYPVLQKIDFDPFDPYEYVLYFNGSAAWKGDRKTVLMGNIGVRSNFTLRSVPDTVFFHSSRDLPFRLESGETFAAPRFRIFTNDVLSRSHFFGGADSPELSGMNGFFGSGIVRQKTELRSVELPSFRNIWNGFYPYRDPAWNIRSYQFYESTAIVNSSSRLKERLAAGDGYATSFPLNGRKTYHVYIRKGRASQAADEMDPLLYASFLGGQEPDTGGPGGERLQLAASRDPQLLELPDDAFEEFGTVSLAGADWSVCSMDENIAELFLNEVSPYNLMREGGDYSYDRSARKISFRSDSAIRDQAFSIGRGDGRTVSFGIGGLHLDAAQRTLFYFGKKKTDAYFINGDTIQFAAAPPSGAEVLGWKIPKIFLRKEAPGRNTEIYIDINDRAVVIDLDKMRNFPRNSVILSELPVLVQGSTRYPLAVLSTANVYLGNVNTDTPDRCAPVYIASGKGVFIYQKKEDPYSIQNKCVVYTPLKNIESVAEYAQKSGPFRLTGSVVFGYESVNGDAEEDWGGKEMVYDPAVREYAGKPPFIYIAKPFTIVRIVRN